MEPNNEKLVELLKISPEKLTQEQNTMLLNELKQAQLFIPVEITSNSFNFDEMEVGKTMSLNEPLRFKPIKLTNDDGDKAIPLFTDSKVMEELNVNASCIAMFTEDIANNFADIKDEVKFLVIDPGTPHSLEILFETFLTLFDKKINEMFEVLDSVSEIFEKHAVPLKDNYKFFLREETPYMKDNAVNGIFTSNIPFNVSTKEDFHKDYPYLNVLLVSEGKRVLYIGNVVDDSTNYDLILEVGIKFELVDELDEHTFIWRSI